NAFNFGRQEEQGAQNEGGTDPVRLRRPGQHGRPDEKQQRLPQEIADSQEGIAEVEEARPREGDRQDRREAHRSKPGTAGGARLGRGRHTGSALRAVPERQGLLVRGAPREELSLQPRQQETQELSVAAEPDPPSLLLSLCRNRGQ